FNTAHPLPPLRYRYPLGDPKQHLLADLVRTQYQKNLGIEVDAVGLPEQDFKNAIATGQYDLIPQSSVIPSWDTFGWFSDTFTCGGSNNVFGYCDQALNAQIKAASSRPDVMDAHAILAQADTKVQVDAPIVPLF